MPRMKGYGRNPPIDWDEVGSEQHRSRHESAVRSLARRHDEERRIERQLEELDRSIVGWSDELAEERRGRGRR